LKTYLVKVLTFKIAENINAGRYKKILMNFLALLIENLNEFSKLFNFIEKLG
jgi:hypothetical protein